MVGIFREAETLAWRTKGSSGITVYKGQYATIVVKTVIKDSCGFSARSVDHILLWVFVKFFR
jgi:hypothetical protein